MMKRWIGKAKAGTLALAGLALLTAACGGAGEVGRAGSPAPSASSSAHLARTYHYDLKSTRAEPMPEGSGNGSGGSDALEVSPADLESVLTLDFDLSQKGDFLIAEGEGVLWTGKRSIPFALDQTSVVREDALTGDAAFVHGTLQAHATGKQKTTFALDFRLLPQDKQIELRMPVGKQFVVYGDSPAMAERAEEIGKLVFR
ncbi:hypothetical protein [Cohnella nanjingensis]|uniref:Uncharacterized protein n=1 Tax=Cohnella nanjingensis TaxID=1387779 RepID=A0A7X0RLJ5_9BACL|nr:hypothetical protein [Cohnella nanjingensis]MBB6669749.1 hypothetical protein [Cohnella nanjingensis]